MSRIVLINPNSSVACTAGIADAVAPFRFPGGPALDVEHLPDGPPAILGWRDWHAVVDPLCRRVSVGDADVFVVACASDPGLEAVRGATAQPVLGVFRCAVSAAVARAERFGVIAIVEASKARHLAALRSMGLERRLAAEIALNVEMDDLLAAGRVRARLLAAARDLVAAGAGVVVLGCTGMAHHRAWLEDGCGVPVIDPCQAAAAQAMAVVLGRAIGGVAGTVAAAAPPPARSAA